MLSFLQNNLPLVVDLFKTDNVTPFWASMIIIIILFAMLGVLLAFFTLVGNDSVIRRGIFVLVFASSFLGASYCTYNGTADHNFVYADIAPVWNESGVKVTKVGDCIVKLSSAKDVSIEFKQVAGGLREDIEVDGSMYVYGERIKLKAGEEKEIALRDYVGSKYRAPSGNCEVLPK